MANWCAAGFRRYGSNPNHHPHSESSHTNNTTHVFMHENIKVSPEKQSDRKRGHALFFFCLHIVGGWGVRVSCSVHPSSGFDFHRGE